MSAERELAEDAILEAIEGMPAGMTETGRIEIRRLPRAYAGPISRVAAEAVLDAGFLSPAEHDRRVQEAVREARREALESAADDVDQCADEWYGEDIFRRPTAEEYAAINELLRGAGMRTTDSIGADCYSRAIKVQATRLRERAREVGA